YGLVKAVACEGDNSVCHGGPVYLFRE
ncbi:MAG: hypothetical protein RJB41_1340, partial [Actinomycetota bacterium]